MGGRPALCVDEGDLTEVAQLVGRHELGQRVLRRRALTQQAEPQRAVARQRERLRRDGTHAGGGPRHDSARAEGAALDGDAELPRLRVARDEGVGHALAARSDAL